MVTNSTETYPTSKTFPLIGTASASWDVGLGNPLSSTDVNNQTTQYQYDAFGRIKAIAEPGDSLSNPTTGDQYHDSPSSWQPIGNYGTDAGSVAYVRSGWNSNSQFILTANTSELHFDTNGTYNYQDIIGRKYTAQSVKGNRARHL